MTNTASATSAQDDPHDAHELKAKLPPDAKAKLIARVEKIYRRFAPGFGKITSRRHYIDAFDTMIPRYLNHRFGIGRDYRSHKEFTDRSDFTQAPYCSDLQPRERHAICGAIEDLLVELGLENIDRHDLNNALYAPVWRFEDALAAEQEARRG